MSLYVDFSACTRAYTQVLSLACRAFTGGRENTASRRPGPGSTAPPARLEVPSGRARPLAFIPRNYKRSPVLRRRAANSARKSRSATWRTGSTAPHLESCGLESPFRACAVALEKKKQHPEAARELLVAYRTDGPRRGLRSRPSPELSCPGRVLGRRAGETGRAHQTHIKKIK